MSNDVIWRNNQIWLFLHQICHHDAKHPFDIVSDGCSLAIALLHASEALM
jgi:hypothetical protein